MKKQKGIFAHSFCAFGFVILFFFFLVPRLVAGAVRPDVPQEQLQDHSPRREAVEYSCQLGRRGQAV